jgi:hypothetical protein
MNKSIKLLLILFLSITTTNFCYSIGLEHNYMRNLLKEQKYLELQQDIYKKYEAKDPEDLQFLYEWIRTSSASSYDILMLYFDIRQCYYAAVAPNVCLQNAQVNAVYKTTILFFIRLFQDVYAFRGIDPTYEQNAAWSHDFLRTKITTKWLPEILKYRSDFKNILKQVRTIVQNPVYLERLQSPAWACCSNCSWGNFLGIKKNTFYFGEPDELIKNKLNSNKKNIDNARSIALSKILTILGILEDDKSKTDSEKLKIFTELSLPKLCSGGID